MKPYKLSNDYNLLFDMLVAGYEALGYVDYKFVGHDLVFRDPCRIARRKEWDINFGVRGMSYASIYDFDRDHWKGDERSIFVRTCENLNLDWIEP